MQTQGPEAGCRSPTSDDSATRGAAARSTRADPSCPQPEWSSRLMKRSDTKVPPGHEKGSWTSNLSVGELAAVRNCGFEPAGFALGASVYRLGRLARGTSWSYNPRYGFSGSRHVAQLFPMPRNASVSPPRAWTEGYEETYECQHVGETHVPGYNYEDRRFEDAVTDAFESAREGLRADAVRLGAHGVVAVRLSVEHPAWRNAAAPTGEIRLVGTAVRVPGADPLDRPFTSHLSGQAFGKLIGAGWVPLDLVVGAGAIRSFNGCVGGPKDLYGRGEFTQRSDALQRCRDIAIGRLATDADGPHMCVIAARPLGMFGPKHTLDTSFEHVLIGTAAVRYRQGGGEIPHGVVKLDDR